MRLECLEAALANAESRGSGGATTELEAEEMRRGGVPRACA